jgi:hypothetical protein
LLTAARFERRGHLNALRYGVAIECVMTATDKSKRRCFERVSIEVFCIIPATMCVIFIFSPQFQSNNPRSILKDNCLAGCHSRIARTRRRLCCAPESGGHHQRPIRHQFYSTVAFSGTWMSSTPLLQRCSFGRAVLHAFAAAGEVEVSRYDACLPGLTVRKRESPLLRPDLKKGAYFKGTKCIS